MFACRFHRHYDPLASTHLIRRVCALLAAALFAVPLVWLDRTNVQVVGFVLYPLEGALNALFFPGVTTPLRGNGTALLVLAPTLALLAVLAFALRTFFAIIRAVCHRIAGRAR